MRTFTAYIEYDAETNSYIGIVPGLSGAHSVGDTLDELQVNLKEVLELVMGEFWDNDPIFSSYVSQRAAQSGEKPEKIAAHIDRNAFYEKVYALHERFMTGEFSLGYMAQQLAITKPDLYHLLDAMELKVTNV